MSEALWLALAAVLSVAGMAWLALAMDVHWVQVMGRPSHDAAGVPRLLRCIGAAALALSLLACLMADAPSMAVLVWVMLLAGAATSIALMLAWRAPALRLLWPWTRS
ncbi:DUF3325 domain-containing protein [Verticiella sediminum]|uniref:DUF3325 domain-containing protein n=1 Tax=Verticiella sediminum TaxID=1247510 RepID=A0A556B251_9BURK|nr:DUF3325 family protein [Verticiella sediminum]TSH99266.1 DUF3325 domain-containing protein [Verticiella sediminum]